MQKLTPFLWFDDQAEETAEFYVSVFNARPTAHAVGSRRSWASRATEGPGRGRRAR